MHFINATTITLGLLLLSLWLAVATTDKPAPMETSARVVIISPQQKTHILYGDKRGGGHFHTADKPCKSEFPASWSQQKIIDTIEQVAANDNVSWKKAENGYYAGEQQIEDLKIRVILAADKMKVITAYPVNVPRNPCPANDR